MNEIFYFKKDLPSVIFSSCAQAIIDTKIDYFQFPIREYGQSKVKNVTCQVDTDLSGSAISEDSISIFKLNYIRQEFPLDTIDCVNEEYFKYKKIFLDENINSCKKYNSKFIHFIFKSYKTIKKFKFIDNSNQQSTIIFDIKTETGKTCEKENDLFVCTSTNEIDIKLYFGIMLLDYELCEIQITEYA